uniref:Uncharacterized protein n=1 Tax=Hucho hucho TaxID=62062 RepID=A0A4W5LX33_9TELE
MAGHRTRPSGQPQSSKVSQFKLVFLGKSSLLLQFVKGQYQDFRESTIGVRVPTTHYNTLLCRPLGLLLQVVFSDFYRGLRKYSPPLAFFLFCCLTI